MITFILETKGQAPQISYEYPGRTSAVDVDFGVLFANNNGGSITEGYTVQTIAGNGQKGYLNGNGTNSSFKKLSGLALDAAGNVYVADQENHRIRKIDIQGNVSDYAGNGEKGYQDGYRMNAKFNSPMGITIDKEGNIYIAEYDGNYVRKISKDGNVSTLAGNGTIGNRDGKGSEARFSGCTDIAVDQNGNLYVTDFNNNTIRKVTQTGEVTTYAGGNKGYQDGLKNEAKFNGPIGLDIDPYGNLFIADYNNLRVRKLSREGRVTTLAGSDQVGLQEGPGNQVSFRAPQDVVVDQSGNVYVSDLENNLIKRINKDGNVSIIAGNKSIKAQDGPALNSGFNYPGNLTLDSRGNIIVSDQNNYRIRKISPNGGFFIKPNLPEGLLFDRIEGHIFGTPLAASSLIEYEVTAFNQMGESKTKIKIKTVISPKITSISPNKIKIGDTVTLSGTNLDKIATIKFSSNKNVDYWKLNKDNTITLATEINNRESQLKIISNENITSYISILYDNTPYLNYNEYNHRYPIYKYDLPNLKMTNNGSAIMNRTQVSSFPGPEPIGGVNPANFSFYPTMATKDRKGNLYVSDAINNKIIIIDKNNNNISTYAGNERGEKNGIKLNASFNYPQGITIDIDGNMYVADTWNHSIRKISKSGDVSTYVGGKTKSGLENGTLETAKFSYPSGLAIDGSGTLYVTDANHRLRRITPDGRVFTVNESIGKLKNPNGIAIDKLGNIYVADTDNNRICKFSFNKSFTVFAGSGNAGYKDGKGIEASFNKPYGLAIDEDDFLYVTDMENNRIRKISPSGQVTTLAGRGNRGNVQLEKMNSSFDRPSGIIVDKPGKVFIIDWNNAYYMRQINSSGYIIDPIPPQGCFNFNIKTGDISLTSSVELPKTMYTITGFNELGSHQVKINMEYYANLNIINVDPTEAYVGDTIMIYGSAFEDIKDVKIGGISALYYEVVDRYKIKAVPGAGSGTEVVVETNKSMVGIDGLKIKKLIDQLALDKTNICNESSVSVSFVASENSQKDGYEIQLSNELGDFSNPISLQLIQLVKGQNNITIKIPSGTKAGNKYRLRIKSKSSLHSSDIIPNITILESPSENELELSPSQLTPLCNGNSITLKLNFKDGNKYQWMIFGNIDLNIGTTNTYSVDRQGIYSCKVTNRFGCEGTTKSVTIDDNTPMTKFDYYYSDVIEMCNNEEIVLKMQSYGYGYENYEYRWFKNNELINSNNPYYSNNELRVNSIGNYRAQITNKNCSVYSDVKKIIASIGSDIKLKIEANRNLCDGDSVFVTGDYMVPTEDIRWFKNDVLVEEKSAYLSVKEAGVYQMQLKNYRGCTISTNKLEIRSYPKPDATLIPIDGNVICNNYEKTLKANFKNGNSYTWFLNGSLLTTGPSEIKTKTEGNYRLYVYSDKHCSSESNEINLKNSICPEVNQVSISSNSFCRKQTLILNFNAINITNSATLIIELSNSRGDFTNPTILGRINGMNGSNTFNYTIPINIPIGTNYVCRVRCEAPNSVIGYSNAFSINPLPGGNDLLITPSTNQTITKGSSIMVGVALSTGYKYQWYRNNQNIQGETSNTMRAKESGIYHCLIQNQFKCEEKSRSITVTVK